MRVLDVKCYRMFSELCYLEPVVMWALLVFYVAHPSVGLILDGPVVRI